MNNQVYMRKKMKIFSVVIIVLLIFTLVFSWLKSVQAAYTFIEVEFSVSSISMVVPTTTIVFTPEGDVEINTNDGIQINFDSAYDISSVVNADVAVTQVNGGTDITKGTAAVSSQNLQIPITTQGDDPDGQITVTISNSHIINANAPWEYQIVITTYDLGDDNAFGGSGGDADVEEDTGTWRAIPGANGVMLTESGGGLMFDPSTVVNAMIVYTPETEINTNDGVQIHFDDPGFDISSLVNGDVAITQERWDTNITKGTAAVSGQNLQIPITTQGSNPSADIGFVLTNEHITTPTAGIYTITVTTWDLGDDNAFGGAAANADTLEHTAKMAVVIGDNQVEISASVDPILSFSLSSSNCDLGTFSTTSIKTCSYNTQVSTNASGGYTAYIKDDGNLQNANSDNISDVEEDLVEDGEGEYGISTTESDSVDIIKINDAEEDVDFDVDDCTFMDGTSTPADASALTTSDQSYATESSPVSADTVYLCHAVSISATTPAGAYSQTVMITVVGNY
jgi:hypothetical protein